MGDSLYSFVIVDDEPEIREGIQDTIPWTQLGFSLVGACVDGFEALELAERIQPDVVLTDINMPFMDGLVFTDRLAVISPATKVLIISGYDDFEYARKAVQLQVYDYIVKPVTPTELIRILEKLKTTLDQERIERINTDHIKQQLSESIPLLRERFLAHLVEGKLDSDVIRERIGYFNLPLPLAGAAYLCVSFDFVHRRGGEEFDIDLLTQRNIIERLLTEPAESMVPVQGIIFQDRDDRLTFLIWGTDTINVYRTGLKTAEFIFRSLQLTGLDDSIVGIGEPVENIEFLRVSYNSAIEALSAASFRGKKGITTYREAMGKPGAAKIEPDPQWDKKIVSALKIGAREAACHLIGEMAADFQNAPFSLGEYHIKLAMALAALIQCCKDLEIPESEIFPSGSDPFAVLPVQIPPEVTQLKNSDDVRIWFTDLVERITNYTQTRKENFAQVKVREALDYIKSHYADPNLSLQSLCKKLDISMSYFSANLKRYHNRTFVEELTSARINRAMELLRTTDLMTYEIAEKIGYRDAHYFSLCFRKFTGFTTMEYRNRNVHD